MLTNCWRRIATPRRQRQLISRQLTDLVRVVEVGPRDGLQNVKIKQGEGMIPTEKKVELIKRLAATGLRSIEVTSFVSPKWVPQMADSTEVWRQAVGDKKQQKQSNVEYSALVPNETGLKAALDLGVREVVLFAAATESFSRRNTNCSVDEMLERAKRMRAICQERGVRARGVISCVIGCPYEGEVDPTKVAKLVEALFSMGCYEVALGDTMGVASPKKIVKLLKEVRPASGDQIWLLAAHLHDTYGQALANVLECLNQGIRVFDSSVAGLGGCPYAPGAAGNLATEDLLYLLHGQGMHTGVDLDKLVQVGDFVSQKIGQPNYSKAGNALLAAAKAKSSQKAQSC